MSDILILDHFRGARRQSAPVLRQTPLGARQALQPTPEDRDARARRWQTVDAELDYWSKLWSLCDAALVGRCWGLWTDKALPSLPGIDLEGQRDEIVRRVREARAAMLMTPAAYAAHLIKKHAARHSEQWPFLGVTEQTYDAQIAADEAFLAACPRREKGSRKVRS